MMSASLHSSALQIFSSVGSFGPKGLKHTVSTTGKSHTTVGIPGTGLSYTTSSGGKSGAQARARSAIPAAQRPTSPKNKTVALLLCIFLGFFGAHRFYVGKPARASSGC